MADAKTSTGSAPTKTPPSPSPKSKERSPNYPSITLTDSITLAQKLYDTEKRTAVPSTVVAKALGYASLNGKARTAIASLRQYGLLEGGASGIKLSDTAMDILHQPVDSSERASAVRLAARRPVLITELLASHGDASDEAIRALLITKKKFSVDGAGRFIVAFRDAARLAGTPDVEYTPQEGGDDKDDRRDPPTGGGAPKPVAPLKGVLMEFKLQLSGVTALVTVMRGVDSDEVEMLGEYFSTAKKAAQKAATANAVATVTPNAPAGAAQA